MHIPSEAPDDDVPVPMGRRTRMLIDALAGAISGCISRVVVGPLDVIKIRFQVHMGAVLLRGA